jgi:hypothetical protein
MQFMSVKTAAHHTVHDFPGGAVALAPAVGLSSGVLSNQVSLTRPQDNLSVTSALRVMGATENYSILQSMAQELGFVVLPMAVGPIQDPHASFLASLFKEVSDGVNALAQSLADGKVTQWEMMNVHKEVDGAIMKLLEAKQLAQRLHDDSKK